MKKITLAKLERKYKNNGQEAERIFRYTLTGIDMKADNREGADLENIQIKSARATVCKGTDIKTFIENDVAEIYAYVTENFENAYLMDKTEWIEFCEMFGTVTTESAKNGGKTKIRLKSESENMKAYLARQAFDLLR